MWLEINHVKNKTVNSLLQIILMLKDALIWQMLWKQPLFQSQLMPQFGLHTEVES